jgi:hypothetical protein
VFQGTRADDPIEGLDDIPIPALAELRDALVRSAREVDRGAPRERRLGAVRRRLRRLVHRG